MITAYWRSVSGSVLVWDWARELVTVWCESLDGQVGKDIQNRRRSMSFVKPRVLGGIWSLAAPSLLGPCSVPGLVALLVPQTWFHPALNHPTPGSASWHPLSFGLDTSLDSPRNALGSSLLRSLIATWSHCLWSPLTNTLPGREGQEPCPRLP